MICLMICSRDHALKISLLLKGWNIQNRSYASLVISLDSEENKYYTQPFCLLYCMILKHSKCQQHQVFNKKNSICNMKITKNKVCGI